ncbi:mobile element protein [Staphylococcus phage Twort]|uniref:Mobile element protein n=2 Tax=Staphylococcus phage Twort (strain DSM 17442 / HER 48) TaxID=2908167 RepID=A0A6H0X5I1_BPTWO|nr:transposase [Staphylococcus phage Twort]AAX92317.1 ORF021 [Staphylococcus phage Twort]QIW89175.1 mobile element protein [Staphylococcus phage Twort]
MITKKVRLKPTKQQELKLRKSADIARFIYNWTLAKQQENYKQGNKFIQDSVLRKEITQLKKTEEFRWLNEVSNNIPKQAVKDACNAYKRFFKKQSGFPKFKSKKKTRPSFYNDTQKLKVKEKSVLLEKVGWVRTSEQLPVGTKYYNPRITFDGKYWYISVSIEEENKYEELTNESLGIDLGIKELAVCSDGSIYENINKTIRVKKLEKRLRRLQRKVSRKYQNNKEGSTFVKTCNIIKLEKQIKLLQRRLSNIRKNYLHQTTTSIVKTKPRRIVIEDLNVSGMMKNRHLAKAIQKQGFYEFRKQLEYKCGRKGIELVIADRFFPSSKTCSNCGNIHKNLKLSDRIFKCDCGFSIDRDLNASINLANYNI